MNIRAVIFDRDNTLVRFNTAAIAELEARVAAAAPGLPAGAAIEHWQHWPGPWPRTHDDEPAFWRAFWAALARAHQLHEGAAGTLEQIGAFYHTCFTAYPDTLACLRALRARGLRLAVLTNFELPSIHLTLRHAGIDPALFDTLLSSASLGTYKPDMRAYLAAAEALGLPPAACAFVDDLPENVQAAHALGMRAWLIDRRDDASDDPQSIRGLSELVSLLA
jgi:putative hydrolase of the HAD superfamily